MAFSLPLTYGCAFLNVETDFFYWEWKKTRILRIWEYANNWLRLVIIWDGKFQRRYRPKQFLTHLKVHSLFCILLLLHCSPFILVVYSCTWFYFGFSILGKDLIGLAQTGSGKTGAFALPILQSLLESPQAFFACVLSPTRFDIWSLVDCCFWFFIFIIIFCSSSRKGVWIYTII